MCANIAQRARCLLRNTTDRNSAILTVAYFSNFTFTVTSTLTTWCTLLTKQFVILQMTEIHEYIKMVALWILFVFFFTRGFLIPCTLRVHAWCYFVGFNSTLHLLLVISFISFSLRSRFPSAFVEEENAILHCSNVRAINEAKVNEWCFGQW